MSELDDDGEPWASPEIRREYEAAIGRLVIDFNEIDFHLGNLIGLVLERLNLSKLAQEYAQNSRFSSRISIIEVLKHTSEGDGLKCLCSQDFKSVSGIRNIVVHGHFDQNPFDGSFVVADQNGRTSRPLTSNDLKSASDQIGVCFRMIRQAQAHYHFKDFKI